MPTVPLPPAPGKEPDPYVLTCVRLVCDVFLSVELVGAFPSAVTAALGMAAHAIRAGMDLPAAVDGSLYRTPVGDRGDRHVYHLVALPEW